MAKVIFKRGQAESLPETYSDGTVYVTTDDRAIYLDISDSSRVRLGISDEELESKMGPIADRKIDEAIDALDLENTYDPKGAADAKDAPIAEAKAAAEAAQQDVDALEGKVGEVSEGKTVVQLIEESKYDDTELSGRVDANEAAIETLNGEKTQDGSVAKQVADAVAGILADAPAEYDTLKEISDWITSSPDGAAGMNSKIAANGQAIEELEALVGELPGDAGAATVTEYAKKLADEAKAYADTASPEWGSF